MEQVLEIGSHGEVLVSLFGSHKYHFHSFERVLSLDGVEGSVNIFDESLAQDVACLRSVQVNLSHRPLGVSININ